MSMLPLVCDSRVCSNGDASQAQSDSTHVRPPKARLDQGEHIDLEINGQRYVFMDMVTGVRSGVRCACEQG